MKNIMITGGAGFIGSNLVLHMLEKYKNCNIFVFDCFTYASNYVLLEELKSKPNLFIKNRTICSYESVYEVISTYDIDTIIHLAAESHVDNSIELPDKFIKTNLVGTFNLLEAARKYWMTYGFDGKRFHHVSTDEVFGSLNLSDESFTEKTPYKPRSPYSASKAGSDHLVMAYYHTYGLPVTISNCSNNYGPYQHNEKLIPKMIECLCEERQIPIYGNGSNIRDWLYVGDHVDAIISIVENGKLGETYNIGGGNEISNIEIAKMVMKEFTDLTGKPTGMDCIKFVEDRKGHDFRYAICFDKIKKELKWEPKTNFKDGIRETIKHYVKKYNLTC